MFQSSDDGAPVASASSSAEPWTLRALVAWWEERFSFRYDSRAAMLGRLRRHLVDQLGHLPCAELTADVLELHLAGRAAELGPDALNHVRSDLRRCIRAAKGSFGHRGRGATAIYTHFTGRCP